MEFIVGGRSQGKRGYMKEKYGIDDGSICDGRVCTPEELAKAAYIDNLHEFVRRFPQCEPVFRKDAAVICDEVGSGIVPIDKAERLWRERVGRVGCRAAREEDIGTRVVFGLPVRQE